MKIGIAITVHNRHDVAQKSIDNIKKLIPKGAKLVIVDDASKEPFKDADFRFDTNVGIAVAKNKCLELLQDCDYIFLFDDDTYPIHKDWYLRYINSGVKHLSFTFERLKSGLLARAVISKNDILKEHKEPCGCMIFLTKEVLQKVGGMDTDYGRWGYEHVGYSMRVYNNYLTPRPFMDIIDSLDYIYCSDWDLKVERSVPNAERQKLAEVNKRKYLSELNSSDFIPFDYIPKDAIITTLFSTLVDPQRGEIWNREETLKLVKPLQDSCDRHGIELIILDDTVNIKPKHENPYFARWIAIAEHLKSKRYRNVFCVDATDVQVLRNPFNFPLENYLYTGDEPSRTNNNIWLKKHHSGDIYKTIFNRSFPLMNAGIVGGKHSVVSSFINQIIDNTNKCDKTSLTDMALFNAIAHLPEWAKIRRNGPQVNTIFKSYQDNGCAWFMHK